VLPVGRIPDERRIGRSSLTVFIGWRSNCCSAGRLGYVQQEASQGKAIFHRLGGMMKLGTIQDVPQSDELIAGPVWTYILAGIAGTGFVGAVMGVFAGYVVTCGPSPCNRFYGADLIRVLSSVPIWGLVFGLAWGIVPSLWLARRSRKSRSVAGLKAWFAALLVALCTPFAILWMGEWGVNAVETWLAIYGASEAVGLHLSNLLFGLLLPFPSLDGGSEVVTGAYMLVSATLLTTASAAAAAAIHRALNPVSVPGDSPWGGRLLVGALAGGLTGALQAVLMLAGYLTVDRTTIYVESPIVMAVYFGLLGGALGFLLGQVPAIIAGGLERIHPAWPWLRWPLSLAAFVATFQILVADFSDRVRSFAGLWEEQNTRLQLMILVGGSVVYVSTTLFLNRWLHPAASEVGVKEPH
jgi:hypothetical protein